MTILYDKVIKSAMPERFKTSLLEDLKFIERNMPEVLLQKQFQQNSYRGVVHHSSFSF